MPLWQRQYTWRIADHRLLWRDILEQYTRAADGVAATESEHFLGSIVLSPVPSAASGVASYLIVDGQQRLATLMLILSAIRDAAAKTEKRAVERYDELYLINKFQKGEAPFRLVPTQADRASFFACVTRGAGAGGEDPIGQAYRFFRSHVELLGPDEEALVRVMAERHELTTEERRRGAYAAAEAKRRKKRAVEQRVVELRAQRKVDRQNNWSAPVRPFRVEQTEQVQPPSSIEPPRIYRRSCAAHGVFNCRSCS